MGQATWQGVMSSTARRELSGRTTPLHLLMLSNVTLSGSRFRSSRVTL